MSTREEREMRAELEKYFRDLNKANRDAERMRVGAPNNVLWLLLQVGYAIQAALVRIEKGIGVLLTRPGGSDKAQLDRIEAAIAKLDPPSPPIRFTTVITAVRIRK